jgi:hypothetical protein
MGRRENEEIRKVEDGGSRMEDRKNCGLKKARGTTRQAREGKIGGKNVSR